MQPPARSLLPLLAALYDAALDEERWPSALRLIQDWIGSDSASVNWSYRNAEDYSGYSAWRSVVGGWADPNIRRTLDTYYARLFPFRAALERLVPGQVYLTHEIFPERTLCNTEYYSDWMRPNDMHHTAGVLVAITPNVFSNLDLQRRCGTRPFGERERLRLKVLAPHVQRALGLTRRLAELRSHSAAFGEVLDRLSAGVAILDGEARLLYANSKAARLLQRGKEVAVRSGKIVFASTEIEPRFDAMVRRAAASAEGRALAGGGTIRVPGNVAHGRIIMHVTPLNAEVTDSLSRLPAARVAVIMRDGAAPSNMADVFSREFGLTPAEARIARGLANGNTLRDLADQFNVSSVTARNQLRAILEKTGTRRQSELMLLLVGHPGAIYSGLD